MVRPSIQEGGMSSIFSSFLFVCESILSFYHALMIRPIFLCITLSFLLTACAFSNDPIMPPPEVKISTGTYERDMTPEKRLEATKNRRKVSAIIRK